MRIKCVQKMIQPESDPATKKMCVILDCHQGPTSMCFDNKIEMAEMIKVLADAIAKDHNIVTFNDNGDFDRREFTDCFREVAQAKPFTPPKLQPQPMGEQNKAIEVDAEVVKDLDKKKKPAKTKKTTTKKKVKKENK